MRWLAFVGDRDIGEVEAPDHDIARARAWARWGPIITRVQSAVEAEVAREEQEALNRNKRIADYDRD